MTLQREAFRVACERASRRVLLAGAQGEHHIVGLEMASSVILHAGYAFASSAPTSRSRRSAGRSRATGPRSSASRPPRA
jgi:hypothetical protein